MKVLKQENTAGWCVKHICDECDSELEVYAEDLIFQYMEGDQREPGYDRYTAQCAVCSFSFDIEVTKIPKLVQLEVKARKASSANRDVTYR